MQGCREVTRTQYMYWMQNKDTIEGAELGDTKTLYRVQKNVETQRHYTGCRRTWRHKDTIQDKEGHGHSKKLCRDAEKRTWRHEEIIEDALETQGDYSGCKDAEGRGDTRRLNRMHWRHREIIQNAGMQKDVEALGDYTRCRRTWRHEEIIQDAGMQKDVETLGDYTRCRRTWRH
ncbi:hypothetical protein PoB_007533300 [Plakobranchus ocellatus]|uniref:Uncharacterized protein n=1 Tax=Plakobranchus ocellatus TaxID=259542 RepID=A0AAV4DX39_9GAST|nr:hypothetical protein PoB_007533300 [Plakobranchus ocellatus]